MSHSLVPFVSRLNIVTKDLRVESLGSMMNHAQHQIIEEFDAALNERRRCRVIILKARQLGVSTITEATMFAMAMIFNNLNGLVVSHESDSARHLLKMTNHYWQTWPYRSLYTIKHDASNHKSWLETGSSIHIATAKNPDAGRSQTIQVLHGSEVGFWDDAITLMTGLAQSIPQVPPSFIIFESTANGLGNYFHEQWTAAVDGDTEYVPLFFPWHQHPEYTAAKIGLSSSTSTSTFLGPLDDEERILKAIGISDDRLVWRRWAIKNLLAGDLMRFHQEYPTTPEEAFIVSGTNIFPDGDLTMSYQPRTPLIGYLVPEAGGKVRFQESIDGPLKLYRWPSDNMEWGKYMIAGDPTRSVHGDYSCAQVLNRRTWEQVATWRGKIDPSSFGDQMALLGRYYNWAMLCPEIQGAGDATISRLISLNYPFLFEHRRAEKIPGAPETAYGWWSGVRSKQEAVGNLLRAVVDHDIVIHDLKTYQEMRGYVSDGKGGFGNGSGSGGKEAHDDTVSALAICLTCVWYEAQNIDASLGVFGEGGMLNGGQTMGNLRALNRGVAELQKVGGNGMGPTPMSADDWEMQQLHSMNDEGMTAWQHETQEMRERRMEETAGMYE